VPIERSSQDYELMQLFQQSQSLRSFTLWNSHCPFPSSKINQELKSIKSLTKLLAPTVGQNLLRLDFSALPSAPSEAMDLYLKDIFGVFNIASNVSILSSEFTDSISILQLLNPALLRSLKVRIDRVRPLSNIKSISSDDVKQAFQTGKCESYEKLNEFCNKLNEDFRIYMDHLKPFGRLEELEITAPLPSMQTHVAICDAIADKQYLQSLRIDYL